MKNLFLICSILTLCITLQASQPASNGLKGNRTSAEQRMAEKKKKDPERLADLARRRSEIKDKLEKKQYAHAQKSEDSDTKGCCVVQ